MTSQYMAVSTVGTEATQTYRPCYCDTQRDETAALMSVSEIINGTDFETLLRLAECPAITGMTLNALALSNSVEVRQAVADHPKTPYMTLIHLSHDSNPDVRFHLAENYNAPRRILGELSHDENPFVSWRAQRTLERKGPAA